MLPYAFTFFSIALAASVLGFIGISGAVADLAKILCAVSFVLFLLSVVNGRRPPV